MNINKFFHLRKLPTEYLKAEKHKAKKAIDTETRVFVTTYHRFMHK